MIPVCRFTTYKDVPYTFLFMNRIRTPNFLDIYHVYLDRG